MPAALETYSIPFARIPGSSRLFLDFLNNATGLRKYYSSEEFTKENEAAYENRKAVAEVLLQQNKLWGCSQKTIENISRFSEPDTVAVVTGQQAGLFGGPALTVYKALTAIAEADELQKKGIPAVPVFWIASEDHDIAEAANTWIVEGNSVTNLIYEPEAEYNGRSVDSVLLNESVGSLLNQLSADTFASASGRDFADLLRQHWRSRAKFTDAFARQMSVLFADHGLILMSPTNRKLRELARPLVRDLISNAAEISRKLEDRSNELIAEGYHAQVNVPGGYFPLFIYDKSNNRRALRISGEGFRDNAGAAYSKEQLLQILEESPERFSPSALFRPVIQDLLLPTACYIGGAAEVAYFAQSEVLYRALNRTLTPIIHRQSFTVIDGRNKRRLDQLEMQFEDLFKGIEKIREYAVTDLLNSTAPKAFSDAEDTIQAAFAALAHEIAEIDTTLLENLARRRRKISRHFASLWKKTRDAQLKNEGVFENRIKGVFAELLPNAALQERSLNLAYFLTRCGDNFLSEIYKNIDLKQKDHVVINL